MREKTARAAIAEIKNCYLHGAAMIDLHLSCLEDRSEENIRAIIEKSPLPVLALNYAGAYDWTPMPFTEEEREALFLASVCTVASNVISKHLFAKVDPITATGCSQLFGGAVLLVVGLMMGGGVKLAKASAIPVFVYILAASIVSYCLWYTIVKGSSLSSLFIIKFAEPLFSCILGALILGEKIWDLRYLIAFVLIGGGITVANGLPRKKKN